MDSPKIPAYIKNILSALKKAGFEAYLAGGCVRDIYMNRRPHDWDMATNALPSQVSSIFPKTIPTGIRHGTITVVTPGGTAELTTFRTETAYSDHRRPDSVEFVSDIAADLSRRDFTVNAMAMDIFEDGNNFIEKKSDLFPGKNSITGKIVDPFGGRRDIDAKIIRCVGDAETRFEEDALRMLRAIRFSAKLSFTIDESVFAAIRKKHGLHHLLSPERIHDETEKILLCRNGAALGLLFTLGLMDRFLENTDIFSDVRGAFSLPSGAEKSFDRIKYIPRRQETLWCALCAALIKIGAIGDAESFLKGLRLSGNTIKQAAFGAITAQNPFPTDTVSIKRLIKTHGANYIKCAAAGADMLSPGTNSRRIGKILRSEECSSLSQLAVSGKDLPGLRGKEIGRALDYLLQKVIVSPELNDRRTLLSLINQTDFAALVSQYTQR